MNYGRNDRNSTREVDPVPMSTTNPKELDVICSRLVNILDKSTYLVKTLATVESRLYGESSFPALNPSDKQPSEPGILGEIHRNMTQSLIYLDNLESIIRRLDTL